MTWSTPSLSTVRTNNRDYIISKLGVPLIPNDYPRVLADANAGNAHLALQYLDWQALQLLPDTAEQQFLDKWANLFLKNSDGSKGRKSATYASGTGSINGTINNVILPQGTLFTAQVGSDTLSFQTTTQTTIGTSPTTFPIRAMQSGSESNLDPGSVLTIAAAIPGIDGSSAVSVLITNGNNAETDDELRARVLARLQQPPMGGDANDYVAWALQVPGVTRAWCSPQEMGIGTVTVRFMMDDLRASDYPATNGFPLSSDVDLVTAYIQAQRPVCASDVFVEAPIPELINFTVRGFEGTASQSAIQASVSAMLLKKAAPAFAINGVAQEAQTIYRAWVSDAVLNTSGVTSFDILMDDHVMPTAGSIAVFGAADYD